MLTAGAHGLTKCNLCRAVAQHLQNAVQGVEGEASKGAQRVLLVVLVVYVVQAPASTRHNKPSSVVSLLQPQHCRI